MACAWRFSLFFFYWYIVVNVRLKSCLSRCCSILEKVGVYTIDPIVSNRFFVSK